MATRRTPPHHLSWPTTAPQVEQLDVMIEELYRQSSAALDAATGATGMTPAQVSTRVFLGV